MSKQIKADDFVALNPVTGEEIAPGRVALADLGFDPDVCKIVIGDSGRLCVEQEGVAVKVAVLQMHWRRVPKAS